MKILLIYPYFIEDRIQAEDIKAIPIGVYSIAAVLKENGHDVEILNWHDIDRMPDKIEATLIEKRPDVIGFSILHANRWGGIEIARIARKVDARIKIIFGGIGASFLWEHLLDHFPEIDFVVIGEGDYSLRDLIEWIEKEGDRPPDRVRGIAFKKEGKIVKTAEAGLVRNLDELPIPAKYFDYQHISTARGCPWACTFCGSPAFWQRKIRLRSPSHVVRELEILYQKGITFFYFSDDTFTVNKNRVIEICRRIIEKRLSINWVAISRVSHIDGDILFWMRMAGCIQISYGIESGSEKIRISFNKQIKTDQIKRAFSLTASYGILSRAYFIYGAPGEDRETIQETIDLIDQIKPLSVIFYILDIFPGTDLYADLKNRLKISDDIWLEKIEGIMYFEAARELSDELMLSFGKKLRRAFYENIHHFVDAIELIDKKSLYDKHADFLSRLGMTFSQGDYSRIEAIRKKDETAEKLYRRSMDYAPNLRAYLGLGMIYQKKEQNNGAKEILLKGTEFFPESKELNLCLGISYMNLTDYDAALSCLSRFPDSNRAVYYMAGCYKALGDEEKASGFLERFQRMGE